MILFISSSMHQTAYKWYATQWEWQSKRILCVLSVQESVCFNALQGYSQPQQLQKTYMENRAGVCVFYYLKTKNSLATQRYKWILLEVCICHKKIVSEYHIFT